MLKAKTHKRALIITIASLILILSLTIYFMFIPNNKKNCPNIIKAPHNKSTANSNNNDTILDTDHTQTNSIPNYYGEIKPSSIEKIVTMDGIDATSMNKKYWVDNLSSSSKLIMSQEQITAFNENNFNTLDALHDLNTYPERLTGDKVKTYINNYKFPNTPMYDKCHNPISVAMYNKIKDNIDLDRISSNIKIKYGITVTRSSIRAFPSEIAAYSNSSTFDRFQETAIEACEKVIVLHKSKDEQWSFVESYNYRGWIKNEDICTSTLTDINYFANPQSFITILQNAAELKHGTNEYKYFMGVKLPIEYVANKKEPIVYIPTIDISGKLIKQPVTLDKNLDYCIGYLPYTRKNVVCQAFKQLGTSYCWGDTGNGRDCSSFIAATFKTMGIYFPRNTDDQELLNLKNIDLKNLSSKDKDKIISTLRSGDVLFMNGHVVMYLGEYKNNKYIIHNSPINRLTTSVARCDVKTTSGTTYTSLYNKALVID